MRIIWWSKRLNFFNKLRLFLRYTPLYLLIFILLFSLDLSLFGQNNRLKFKHKGIVDGLSQSWVRCIIQDKYGFMWFGTDNGLNRYDGKDFVVYFNEPGNPKSLSGSRINALYEDKSGNLWIGTLNGLNLFDRKTNSFIHESNWPFGVVTSIIEDKIGNLWIGCHNGLYSFDRTKKSFKKFESGNGADKISNPTVTRIFIDKKDNIWIGTMNGINVIPKSGKAIIQYFSIKNNSNSLQNNDIRSIIEDEQGRLWLGTANGLDIFINAEDCPEYPEFIHLQNNNSTSGLAQGAVLTIFKDKQGSFYISSENSGLNVINSDKVRRNKFEFEHYSANENEKSSLSNNSIYSIYEDNQNNIWIGTHGDGLNIYNPLNDKFELIQKSSGQLTQILNNQVNVFLEEDEFLWIGTEGGLSRTNKKTGKTQHFLHNPNNMNSLRSNAVLAIIKDRENNIWVGGMDMGLSKFNPATLDFTNYIANPVSTDALQSNNIFALYQDKKGRIWTGQVCGGLSLFYPKTGKFKTYYKTKGVLECIKSISESADGKLWLITANSIDNFDPEKGTFISYTNNPNDSASINSNWGFSQYIDSKGNYWVGTDAGLNLFDNKSKKFKKHFTIKDGLPDNAIKSIIEDNSGNLWIGTDKGLSKFVNGISFPEKIRFINYSIQDGLQANEFRKRTCYKNSDGKLYFGGINGYNAFFPDSIKENTHVPNIVITELLIFNKKVEPGIESSPLKEDISTINELQLSYYHSVITFKFASLNYIASQKNQYKYILEGFEKEWNHVGNKTEATYTNLSPGTYTFIVKGSNNDGVWNEQGRSLTLVILPPWWKTWWFRTLLYSCIALLIFIFINFRIKFYRSQSLKLSQMVKERTKELEEAAVMLEEKHEEINIQNEELVAQRNELENTNQLLVEQKKQINQQNEELMSQRDALEEVNKTLEFQKEKIVEQNIELDKHRNELEKLVETRTHQLIIAKDKAEEADRLKSSFLANLSHEIRTPLNAIIGFSNLAFDDLASPDERVQFKQIIQSNSDSLLSLINDIIDFSKIESGHIDVIIKEASLSKIMQEMQHIFTFQLKKQQINFSRNIEFRVNHSKIYETIFLETDEIRVKQILSNLIHNAIKFTLEGYIEVGCKILGNNELVEFYVKDTGVGIKEEFHEIIFQRFRKVEEDSINLHRGAGIGLAISSQLVNLLGGQIRVESVHGEGSTFYFTIPVKKNPISKPESNIIIEDNEFLDFNNRKILVAEDDLANYIYIEKILRRFNLNILHALNGNQAIYLLGKNPDIELVLMDIKMPELDGIQALHQIRKKGIMIPVVAQTAYALAHEIMKLKEDGFNDYISKPLNVSDISKVLKTWLKK